MTPHRHVVRLSSQRDFSSSKRGLTDQLNALVQGAAELPARWPGSFPHASSLGELEEGQRARRHPRIRREGVAVIDLTADLGAEDAARTRSRVSGMPSTPSMNWRFTFLILHAEAAWWWQALRQFLQRALWRRREIFRVGPAIGRSPCGESAREQFCVQERRTFQKVGWPFSTPVMLERKAVGATDWPSGIYGTSWNACSCSFWAAASLGCIKIGRLGPVVAQRLDASAAGPAPERAFPCHCRAATDGRPGSLH